MVTGLQRGSAVTMGCRDDKWQSVWHQICLLISDGKQRTRTGSSFRWQHEWREEVYLSGHARACVCVCVRTRVCTESRNNRQTAHLKTLTLSGAWLWRLPTSSGVMRGTFWKPSSTLTALAPLSWRLLPSFTIFGCPCISPLFPRRLLLDRGDRLYSWLRFRVKRKNLTGRRRGLGWPEILTLLQKQQQTLYKTA